MSVAIIQITQAEVAAKAINTSKEKLTFENQVFAKGPSFSLRWKEPALKYCQQMAKKKLKTLLIQEKYGFTIWTQFPKTKNQPLNIKEYNTRISSSIEAKQQSVSKIQRLKQYESQVDEVSQKDSQDASADNLFHRTLLRKYRGHYIN